MATSVTGTGITFPDSTVQTTATGWVLLDQTSSNTGGLAAVEIPTGDVANYSTLKVLIYNTAPGTTGSRYLAGIISSCTYEKVDPFNVPMFDVEFLFLRIRGKSVGEKIELNLLCPDDNETYANVEVDSFYENFSRVCRIPTEILAAPYKGVRKLRFRLVATSVGVKSNRAAFAEEDLNKIYHIAHFDYNYEFKEIGYLENFLNRERVEELSIDLGMCIAASDGKLQQKELDVIKDWANLGTLHLEADRAEEKKEEYSKYIKASYNKAKAKKLSLSEIVEEINEKAGREQKYEAIDLMLKIAGADDKLSKEEDAMLNKIVKKLELEEQVYNEMKNKTLATVGKIETSKGSVEGLLGIKSDMTDKQKCKELRKQYSKWNSQTNSSNDKIKERAKEMVKIIADLRTKYNC